MEGLRFKRRSDLLNFSTKYPGALGAAFLIQLKAKLHGGAPRKLGDLYRVDPTVWALTQSQLKEMRDIREVQSLSAVLLALNTNNIPRAVDMVCQRIREIKQAKGAGGSWEKAELLSLLPSTQASSTVLPDGAMGL